MIYLNPFSFFFLFFSSFLFPLHSSRFISEKHLGDNHRIDNPQIVLCINVLENCSL